MTTRTAPQLIGTYFEAAVAPDPERYVALFAADAVVEDDGRTLVGRDAIREWRAGVPSVTYDLGKVVEQGDSWSASASVAGDFPGSPVDLGFRFRFDADGLVTALRIAP